MARYFGKNPIDKKNYGKIYYGKNDYGKKEPKNYHIGLWIGVLMCLVAIWVEGGKAEEAAQETAVQTEAAAQAGTETQPQEAEE